MMTSAARLATFGLAVTALVSTLLRQEAGRSSHDKDHASQLVNTCLITADIQRLVSFYEPVLGIKPVWSGQDYAEFRTGVGVLAVFSSAAQEKYIPGAT